MIHRAALEYSRARDVPVFLDSRRSILQGSGIGRAVELTRPFPRSWEFPPRFWKRFASEIGGRAMRRRRRETRVAFDPSRCHTARPVYVDIRSLFFVAFLTSDSSARFTSWCCDSSYGDPLRCLDARDHVYGLVTVGFFLHNRSLNKRKTTDMSQFP